MRHKLFVVFLFATMTSLFIIAFYVVAFASPPEQGSEDYELLSPYSEWLHNQTVGPTGPSCCNLADCRSIKYRIKNNEIEVYITKDKYGDGVQQDRWLIVPNEVVHKEHNPTGIAVSCYSPYRTIDNGFYCFWLPDLT